MFYTKAFGRKDVYQQECLRISFSGHGKRLENTSSTSEEKELGLVQSFPLAAQLLGRCLSFPCNHLFCAKFSRCFKREIIRYHFAMEHEERHPNTHSFFQKMSFLDVLWSSLIPFMRISLAIIDHSIFAKAGEVSLFSFSRTRPVPQPWHAYSFTIQDENGENFVVCVVSLEFLSQDPCSCCYFWGGFSSRAGTWQLCRWDGRSSPLASLPEVDGRNQAPAPFHQHRWAK